MRKKQMEALVKDLTCDNVIKCQNARRTLVSIGHDAVPWLVEALGNKREWVRWEATKALGQIADPAATDALIKALQDDMFDVRWLAAEGLIAIGKKAVPPMLRDLIANPSSTWLREGVHHVLHDMDRGDWDEILKPVMAALDSFEPSLEVLPAAKIALDAIENLQPDSGRSMANL